MLIDKATFPRDKCCGDGLTTLALRELEAIGFDPKMVDDWFEVDAAWLRAPTGGRFACHSRPVMASMPLIAPRAQLDAALVELAGRQVPRFALGAGFDGFERRRSTPADGARTLVLSDGTAAHRPPRRRRRRDVESRASCSRPPRPATSASGTPSASTSAGHGSRGERLYVWFDADLLPGYAWSFPLPGGRVNVGFGVLRADGRTGREMKESGGRSSTGPTSGPPSGRSRPGEERHQAWPIPAWIDDAACTTTAVLFIGDAAAATDVLTGEGSGRPCCPDAWPPRRSSPANPVGPAPRRRPRQRCGASCSPTTRFGLPRPGLAHRRGADGAMAIVAHSGSWGRRNFARWMFEDEPRALRHTAPVAPDSGTFAGSQVASPGARSEPMHDDVPDRAKNG